MPSLFVSLRAFLVNDLSPPFGLAGALLVGAFLGAGFGLVEAVLCDVFSVSGLSVARTKFVSNVVDLQMNTTGLKIHFIVIYQY